MHSPEMNVGQKHKARRDPRELRDQIHHFRVPGIKFRTSAQKVVIRSIEAIKVMVHTSHRSDLCVSTE